MLTFEPGSQKECITINTTDDNIATEEDLESFYVYWYTPNEDIYFYHSDFDDEAKSVVSIEDNDGTKQDDLKRDLPIPASFFFQF